MLYLLALYCSLTDPEWDRREAASAALLHLIDRHPAIYGPRLAELTKSATEPEVRARVRVPLACYYRWRVASYVPRTVPVYPICDAFPVACPVVPFGLVDVRCKCSWPVECYGNWQSGGPMWIGYRKTTETRIRGLIAGGMSYEDADALLERMYVLEVRAKCDCNLIPQWAGWRGGYPAPRSEP